MGRLVYHDLASLDGGANFALGECVLVRIPGRIQVEGHVENDATQAAAPTHFTWN